MGNFGKETNAESIPPTRRRKIYEFKRIYQKT
jgi:hypothetical protein